MARTSHLWLLGLSGSGKSTVGPLLAQKLSLPFADTDEKIVQAAQCSISQIFAQGGEADFRQRETQVVTSLAQTPPSVISCGAGVILDPTNRLTLAQFGLRIYLQADPAHLVPRLAHHTDRPLLPADQLAPQLARQLSQRKKWYEESEIQISIGSDTPPQICARILASLPAI